MPIQSMSFAEISVWRTSSQHCARHVELEREPARASSWPRAGLEVEARAPAPSSACTSPTKMPCISARAASGRVRAVRGELHAPRGSSAIRASGGRWTLLVRQADERSSRASKSAGKIFLIRQPPAACCKRSRWFRGRRCRRRSALIFSSRGWMRRGTVDFLVGLRSATG